MYAAGGYYRKEGLVVQEEKRRVMLSHAPLYFHHTHPTGTYLLEVLSPKYYFSQVRPLLPPFF